jgi:quercetin dioxygenase-like cupin family protein
MAIVKKKEQLQVISDNFQRKVIHLDHLMMVICEFTNGPMQQPDPPHSHPHEQITYVAEGELILFVDGEPTKLETGDVYAIPGNMPHCIQTLTAYVKLIDSFTPLRDEFIVQ